MYNFLYSFQFEGERQFIVQELIAPLHIYLKTLKLVNSNEYATFVSSSLLHQIFFKLTFTCNNSCITNPEKTWERNIGKICHLVSKKSWVFKLQNTFSYNIFTTIDMLVINFLYGCRLKLGIQFKFPPLLLFVHLHIWYLNLTVLHPEAVDRFKMGWGST
jgi:hypothetical protein